MLHETHALKAAYVLSDAVLVLGQLGTHLQFGTRAKKFSFKEKLDFMETKFKETNYTEGLNYISYVKHSVKQFNNTKHPTKQLIVANTTLERVFLKYFEEYLININISLKGIGLSDMGALLEKDVVNAYALGKSIPDLIDQSIPDINLAEGLLTILYPSGNPDDTLILFVPLDFISNDFAKYVTAPENSKDIQEAELGTVEPMRITDYIQLTTLEYLSASELKTLRNQLKKDGRICREKIEEFIKLNHEGIKTVPERKQFMDDEFSLEVSKLQAKFDGNAFINFKKVNEPTNAFTYPLYVGEAPLEYYWKYFEEFKIFNKPTLDYVKEQVASNEKYQRHIPFVCVSCCFTNHELMEVSLLNKKNDVESQSPKKFISIDD
jgi:hypothetical protein